MKKKRKSRKIIIEKLYEECYFCSAGKKPSYKESEDLAKFLTGRAKIMGNARTGLCSNCQRRLSTEVKRARHLALLPFAPGV